MELVMMLYITKFTIPYKMAYSFISHVKFFIAMDGDFLFLSNTIKPNLKNKKNKPLLH